MPDGARSYARRTSKRTDCPSSVANTGNITVGVTPKGANLQIVVNVDVDDLERAIEFYTTALGLRLGRRLFEGSVAEMLGATSTIHLLSKPSGSTAVPGATLSRAYERHWTPVHLDFAVDDIFATVERAVGFGAKLEGEIEFHPWGRLAAMSDPFGHGFCVLQFSRNGYDEVREMHPTTQERTAFSGRSLQPWLPDECGTLYP